MGVVRSTREGIRIFQLPAPEKEAKIYERQGLIAAVVIALITTFGFAFTILQANLSDQNRLLGYSIVLVALLALFFGVWYGPLKEYQSKLRIRRHADRVAKENLPRLLELAREFRKATSNNVMKSINYTVLMISSQIGQTGRKLPQVDIPYHFDSIVSTIERLGSRKGPIDYSYFFELGVLLNSAVNEFNYRLQDALLAIRKAKEEGVVIQGDLVENYRDARLAYMNFLDDLEKFGGKIEAELGVAPHDPRSTYRSPFHSYTSPKEL